MNKEPRPIYDSNDPCVTLFYSHKEETLCFSVRVLTQDNSEIDGEITILSPLPSDKELGTIIQQRLKNKIKVRQTLNEIILERNESTTPASVFPHEPDYPYWPFLVWTKTQGNIPFILGVPISNFYDEFPLRLISRETPALELGSAIRRLIYDVSLRLRQAGLTTWQDADRKGTWLSDGLSPAER